MKDSDNADVDVRLIDKNDPDALLLEKQAAAWLGLSVRTLQGKRANGTGPKFVKYSSRAIRYRVRDLLTFLDLNTRRSTSDTGTAA